MKLTISATIENLDRDKYATAVRDEMRRVFFKGAQRLMLAAIPRIPIWTGMARGAFLNLEDLVGKVTKDAQSGGYRIRTTRSAGIRRLGGGRDVSRKPGYYYYPPGAGRVLRTPQAGRAFSTPTEDIMPLTAGFLAKGRTAYYFRYQVNLTYFDMLEPKWGAFKAGEQAMMAYVEENFELPDPMKYLIKKTVRSSF
jgi:hypothetical protein